MPMIDIYAPKGLIEDKSKLLMELTHTLMKWEKVPPIDFFKDNTAAYLHEMEPGTCANANGKGDYVRIQILTPVGTLDQDKKLGVTKDMALLVADAAGDPSQSSRVWTQIVEAPDGGWGIGERAYTNEGIVSEAKRLLSMPKDVD